MEFRGFMTEFIRSELEDAVELDKDELKLFKGLFAEMFK